MRPHEIESWALNIIDRVRLHQPIEDVRVELKTEWPDNPKKAARQIAGHANAARGAAILWLIGVNEARGDIPGVDFTEFSSWYNSVRAAFDELAPEPVSLNIPTSGVTVAALYFETDRAPFVVKNPEGGTVQREVPWREATGIKSATRSQLLQILSPLQKLPQIELIGALILAEPSTMGEPSVRLKSTTGELSRDWKAHIALYITQTAGQESVIPTHKCSITFGVPGYKMIGPLDAMRFRGSTIENVHATQNGVSIRGPARFEVLCYVSLNQEEDLESMFGANARIDLGLYIANAERSITIEVDLPPYTSSDKGHGRWKTGNAY